MTSFDRPPASASRRPEWKLVLACSRLRLDEMQTQLVKELLEGELDWADVLDTARRHRVESLVYHNLSSQFAATVPPSVMRLLDETSRAWGKRALFFAAQVVDLLDRFGKEGLHVIPYKGPTLAALAYSNFALRRSEDLDFVLPQKEVTPALRVLASANYLATLDPTVEGDARMLADGKIGQYSFFSTTKRTLVELHSEKTLRYFPVHLDWEGLSDRLIPVSIGGRPVRTFSIEDTLLLLSVHGAKHFWNRLIWLCDIAALVQNRRVDWELSENLARRMGCRRMWLLALALANQVLDAPLPMPILRKIGDDSVVTALCRDVKFQLARRDEVEPGALQRLLFRLRSHETWSQGVQQCFRFATRPTEEDHRAYKLQKWAAPLFLFLRPWRLLQDYGIGLRRKESRDLSSFDQPPAEIVDEILHLADVRENDTLYDLGCGDGRIAVAAAKRFGSRAVGVDVQPTRIAEARANIRHNGLESLVSLRAVDAQAVNLSAATVVTMSGGSQQNLLLLEKLRRELSPGARVVSRDYCIPGWLPDESKILKLSRQRTTVLYLWRIPEMTGPQQILESKTRESE